MVEHVMLPEMLPVVRHENDDGVLEKSTVLESHDEIAKQVVELGEGGVVDGAHDREIAVRIIQPAERVSPDPVPRSVDRVPPLDRLVVQESPTILLGRNQGTMGFHVVQVGEPWSAVTFGTQPVDQRPRNQFPRCLDRVPREPATFDLASELRALVPFVHLASDDPGRFREVLGIPRVLGDLEALIEVRRLGQERIG